MLSVACQVLKKGKKFKVPVNNIYFTNFACFFFKENSKWREGDKK